MYKPWYTYLYIKSPIIKIAVGILSVLIAVVVILIAGVLEESRMEAQTNNWEGRSIEKGAEIFANNCSSCHGLDGRGAAGPALHSKYFFTQRLADLGYAGTQLDFVELTIAAGRPSKTSGQWAVIMPTWSNRFGGPLRDDQVEQVAHYVMNWQDSALAQTDEEDPWIPFVDTASRVADGAAGESAGADGGAGSGEPRAPAELFVSMGCSACHRLDLPQTDTERGAVGPNMGNLPETAGERVEGQDAETYVHNSIVNPNEFVNVGYPTGIMPPNFAEKMSEEEISGLVQWLLDPNRSE